MRAVAPGRARAAGLVGAAVRVVAAVGALGLLAACADSGDEGSAGHASPGGRAANEADAPVIASADGDPADADPVAPASLAGADDASADVARWLRRADLGFAPMPCGRASTPTILEVNGGGAAIFDADGDGDMDVALIAPGAYPVSGAKIGGSNRLYRNDDGTFVDVTAGSGVDVARFCNGVAVGDVDADGRRDLFLTCWGPNVVLRNAGAMRFEPVELGAEGDGWSTSACFADLDRDGDLDLYVTDYLAFDADAPPVHGREGRHCEWMGMPVMCGPQGLAAQPDHAYELREGRFVDVTEAWGFAAPASYGLGVIDGDFDADGWPDLYVSNDSMPNFLFLGEGGGRVRERGLLSGTALSARGREQAGMGIAAGDLDGDGDEDLMVTNFSSEPNAVYRHLGDGLFSDDGGPLGLAAASRRWLGWGVAFLDVDLDADLDVITANGHVYSQADAPGTGTSWAQPDLLWLNEGTGRCAPLELPGSPAVSRALAVGDLDEDRRADLLVTTLGGAPIVWRGVAEGAVLRVVLRGPPGNPDLLGATVRWVDEGGTRTTRVRASAGYQASSDPRPWFAWRSPGTLRVTSPRGTVREIDVAEPGDVTLGFEDER